MGIYALLKDLRDVLWTKIFGFKFIGLIKYSSFFASIAFWILFKCLIKKRNLSSLFFSLSFFYSFFFGLFFLFLLFFEPFLFTGQPFISLFTFIFYIICEGFPVFMYGLAWGLFDYLAKKDDSSSQYGSLITFAELGGALALSFVYISLLKGLIKKFSTLFLIIFFCFCFVMIGAFLIKRYFSAFYVPEKTDNVGPEIISYRMLDDFSFCYKNILPLFIFMLVFSSEVFNTGFYFLRLEIFGKDAVTHLAILSYLAQLYKTSLISYIIGGTIIWLSSKCFLNLLSIREKIFFISVFFLVFAAGGFISFSGLMLISVGILFKAFQRTIVFSLKEELFLLIDRSKRISFKVFIDSFAARAGKFFMGSVISLTYVFFRYCGPCTYVVVFLCCSLILSLLGYFISKKID